MRFGLVLRSSLLVSLSVILTGCALTPTAKTVSGISAPAALHGKAHGGQQPIAFATVYLFQVGTSDYGQGASVLAQTTTDQNGDFAFSTNSFNIVFCPSDDTPVYLVVQGGSPGLPDRAVNNSIALAAGLGTCAAAKNQYVDVNEVTTAVTAFALSHFFTITLGGNVASDEFGSPSADAAALALSNSSTIQTLVDLTTGNVQLNTAQTTIEAAKIYSIANTLAACVNSYGGDIDGSPCDDLFSYTTPPKSATNTTPTVPIDTLQAAVQMALYPYQNVEDLYNQAGATPPYAGLGTAPSDWTVGVSYQTSNFALSINGTATSTTSTNIDIDTSGRIWFPSNGPGLGGVGYFDPASASFNGPYLTSLFHPQYLAISGQGMLYATDMAENYLAYTPVTAPTTLTYVYDTAGESGPVLAINNGDTDDNVFYVAGGTSSASTGSEAYDLEPDAAPPNITDIGPYSQPVQAQAGQETFGGVSIVGATSGTGNACTIDVPNYGILVTGGTTGCISGGVAIAVAANDVVTTINDPASQSEPSDICTLEGGGCVAFPSRLLFDPKGLALDGDGHFWVANYQDGSVATFFYDPSIGYYNSDTLAPYMHNSQNGSTMPGPFGIAIDGSGNVWVSNAGCVAASQYGCTPGAFVLSELIGAAAPTITPLAAQASTNNFGFRPDAVRSMSANARPSNRPMATTARRTAIKTSVRTEGHLIEKQ